MTSAPEEVGWVPIETPEWLPEGWVATMRTRKNGKVDKCFCNPSTGSKFFSKITVCKYLESEEHQTSVHNKESRITMNSHGEIDTSSNQREIVNYKFHNNTTPLASDKLPEGWKTEFKLRKSGSKVEKDPFYVDPISGYGFRSRKDVHRYLATGDVNKCVCRPSKKAFLKSEVPVVEQPAGQDTRKTSSGVLRLEPAVKIGDSPSWLPSGWITEIRTTYAGRECKSYFNPLTEIRFPSQSEVMQYLKSEKLHSRLAKRKISGDTSLAGDIHTRTLYSSGELPDGWMKVTKVRKSKDCVKKDPYYIDPISGYAFLSRRDARRYLETGDFNSCVMKPKKLDMSNTNSIQEEGPSASRVVRFRNGTEIQPSPACHGDENFQESATKKTPQETEVDISQDKVPDVLGKSNMLSHRVNKKGQILKKQGSAGQLRPRKTKTFKATTSSKQRKNKISFNGDESFVEPARETKLDETKVNLCENKDLHMLSKLNKPSGRANKNVGLHKKCVAEQVDLQKQGNAAKLRPKKTKGFKPSSPSIRSPKRQSGVKTNNVIGSWVTGHPAIVNLERLQAEEPTRVEETKASGDISDKIKNQEGAAQLCQDPAEQLALIKANDVVDSLIRDIPYWTMPTESEPLSVLQSICQSSGKPEELETLPTVNQDFFEKLEAEKLAGAGDMKLTGETPDSPLIFPFGDSWSDPCLEFAFKTLTSDYPVLEDTASLEDYFQQQLIPSPNQGNRGLTQPSAQSGIQEDGMQPEIKSTTSISKERELECK